MDAIIVRLIDLPPSIGGCTTKDAAGDYNIYINARLDGEARAKAFRHEIEHIRRGHFYEREKTVEQMEGEANGDAEEDAVRALAPDFIYR